MTEAERRERTRARIAEMSVSQAGDVVFDAIEEIISLRRQVNELDVEIAGLRAEVHHLEHQRELQ
jgi:hypothetical protein